MGEMRVYLESMSRDREGFVGEWFTCPVNWEEVMEKLIIENEEQFEIADSELPFPVRADMPLWELNVICSMVQDMEGTPMGNQIKAIIERWFSDFVDFMDHKDEIRYYAVQDSEDLARYLLLEEKKYGEIPDYLVGHIKYAAYGRDLESDDRYLFTPEGVFCYL